MPIDKLCSKILENLVSIFGFPSDLDLSEVENSSQMNTGNETESDEIISDDSLFIIPNESIKKEIDNREFQRGLSVLEEMDESIFKNDSNPLSFKAKIGSKKKIHENYQNVPITKDKKQIIDSSEFEGQSRDSRTGTKCKLCFKTFSDYSDFIKHYKYRALIPGGLKCPDCPKTYKNNHSLKAHMEASHEGKRIKCRYCQREFINLFNATCHEKKFHPDEFVKRKHQGHRNHWGRRGKGICPPT